MPWSARRGGTTPRSSRRRAAGSGPDVDGLRAEFDDLLADSAGAPGVDGDDADGVRDHQVQALDAAHDLLARALSALDSSR